MTVDIYYFSSTGNTLYAAKYLAGKTGANLIPMANALKNGKKEPMADCIGIVFPTYFASNKDGVPLVVKRFIKNLEGLEDKYIFAVCTCGYMPGTTIGSLAKKIKDRGGKLAAGFNVNMAQGSLKSELVEKARQISGKDKGKGDADKNIQSPEKKLEKIAEIILRKESARLETRGILSKILNAPLRALIKPIFLFRYWKLSGKKSAHFWKLIPFCDNALKASSTCTGCGTCAKVCPVNNIKIAGGRPKWQHRCENCLACYSWCPNNAICGELVKYNPNFHHPEIALEDML